MISNFKYRIFYIIVTQFFSVIVNLVLAVVLVSFFNSSKTVLYLDNFILFFDIIYFCIFLAVLNLILPTINIIFLTSFRLKLRQFLFDESLMMNNYYLLNSNFNKDNNQDHTINKIFNESSNTVNFFNHFFKFTESVITLLIFTLPILFFIKEKIFYVLLLVIFLLFFYKKFIFIRIAKLSKNRLMINQKIFHEISLYISNFREIALNNLIQNKINNFKFYFNELNRFTKTQSYLTLMPRIIAEFFLIIAMLFIINLTGNKNDVMNSQLLLIIYSAYKLIQSVLSSLSSFAKLKTFQASKDLFKFLLINDLEKFTISNNLILKSISVRNLTIKYGSNLVIKNFSHTFSVGKTYLLHGNSGSGKSSILDFMFKLNSSKAKSIVYNFEKQSYDINDLNFRYIHQLVSYVSQEPELFPISLRNNIIGNNKFDYMKFKNIYDLLDLNSIVNINESSRYRIYNKSINISKGQKLRVAIARALYSYPKILVLDESLSSIEKKLETKILINLRKSFPNLLIIIVSHRVMNKRLIDKSIDVSKYK